MLTSRLAPSAQGDALPVLLNCDRPSHRHVLDELSDPFSQRLIDADLGVRQRQMPSNIGVERFMRAA